jgi:hypothetical protein
MCSNSIYLQRSKVESNSSQVIFTVTDEIIPKKGYVTKNVSIYTRAYNALYKYLQKVGGCGNQVCTQFCFPSGPRFETGGKYLATLSESKLYLLTYPRSGFTHIARANALIYHQKRCSIFESYGRDRVGAIFP